ncbi:hypothetical protein [Microcoleus sp. herbarium14]|uniref:hypothetical protein n=1 Tax=Microcoleus sp. herbarium14 TaxID=3055439 RepID=UPI002FD0F706
MTKKLLETKYIDMYQLLQFDPADDWSFKYQALQLNKCSKAQQSKIKASLVVGYHYLDCWALELQTDKLLSNVVQTVAGYPADLRMTLNILENVIRFSN